jgi:hypothetical protein
MGIEHLSTGALIVEKRLAYLVLLQEKRNNLIQLYNFLGYTTFASVVDKSFNTREPIIGTITTPSGAITRAVGWFYGYTVKPLTRSRLIVKICLEQLFLAHPLLKQIIGSVATDSIDILSDASEWVVDQLTLDDPITLLPIDSNSLIASVESLISPFREVETPHIPQGAVLNEDDGDVSSEISSSDNTTLPLELPQSVYDSPVAAKVLEDSPGRNYSPLTNDQPDNTLPEC